MMLLSVLCVCPRCGYGCAGRTTVLTTVLCANVRNMLSLRSVQLDLERSIRAVTVCHWRSEDNVVERVEPYDDVAQCAWTRRRNYITAQHSVRVSQQVLRETHRHQEELLSRTAEV